MRHRIFVGIALVPVIVVALTSQRVDAAPIAYHVDTATSSDTTAVGMYDSAFIDVFIDPSRLNWIAWNDTPTVSLADGGCSAFVGGAGACLGPGGFGSDDEINLTVTSPDASSATVTIDQNDDWGVSFGQQNVLVGTAADAPDVLRSTPSWHPGGSVTTIVDEAGVFDPLFTTAGMYRFEFSFMNLYNVFSGHPDIYLMVDSRPEGIPDQAGGRACRPGVVRGGALRTQQGRPPPPLTPRVVPARPAVRRGAPARSALAPPR